jgi:hypothetical protein
MATFDRAPEDRATFDRATIDRDMTQMDPNAPAGYDDPKSWPKGPIWPRMT